MTHASVFSGIGGPEVAATMLGWENLFHCEINPFGRKVLDYWYPNSKSYEDITTTDFTEWRGRVDVLTGGFPCQPFSYAGQRRGAEDDRYLWPHMFRCIDEVLPTWVIAENVAGILTMVEQGEVSQVGKQTSLFDEGDVVQRYRLQETFTLERICSDLESHGYAVQPILIPACAVGAPHRRDRVFIIGHRRDTDKAEDGAVCQPQRTICDTADKRPRGTSDRRATDQVRGEIRGERDNAELRLSTETSSRDEPFADTDNDRLQYDIKRGSQAGMFGTESERRQNGVSEQTEPTATNGERRTFTDTDRNRGCEMDKYMESEQPNGAEPFGNGRERNASDTESKQGDGVRPEQPEDSRTAQEQFGGRGSKGSYRVGERWSGFPSVSPVHRGNDGIPFDVDSLSISFGKWRTESLKAYGNAIVPQVMYEIFRAIEIASK